MSENVAKFVDDLWAQRQAVPRDYRDAFDKGVNCYLSAVEDVNGNSHGDAFHAFHSALVARASDRPEIVNSQGPIYDSNIIHRRSAYDLALTECIVLNALDEIGSEFREAKTMYFAKVGSVPVKSVGE